MSKEELKRKAAKLAEKYSKEISNKEDFVQEINHITLIHNANFGKIAGRIGTVKCFGRVQIRKYISQPQCQFKNVPSAPARVASAERSFSKLKLMKSYLRSTMGQDYLPNLARLSIESDIAKQIDFDSRSFAKKKARKATLF